MLTLAALGSLEQAAPQSARFERSRAVSDDWIRHMAAAASSLEERIIGGFVPVSTQESERLGAQRLERWCEIVAEGDIATLERRLVADGLSIERVLPFLGDVELPPGYPVPAWPQALAKLCTELRPSSSTDDAGLLVKGDPLPFEEGLVPFVKWASQWLSKLAGGAQERLSPEANTALERGLFVELSKLMGPTLHLELTVLVHYMYSDLGRLFARKRGERPRELYKKLIRDLQNPRELFTEYPALGRAVVTLIERWALGCSDFLVRLEQDSAQLSRIFGKGRPLGRVTELTPDLSDPHNGRQTVFRVGFESGVTLAYKPRSVRLERGLHRLLSFLNANGAPITLRAPVALSRKEYGWVEWVCESPCNSEGEALRYFERAGALVAVVHALWGTDCHAGNIVASGDMPILIDAETLFQPEHKRDRSAVSFDAAESLERSVIRTALLPHRLDTGVGGAAIDPSGLGAQGEASSTYPIARWEHLGTDDMTLTYEPVRIEGAHGRPSIRDYPEESRERILSGFEAMTRFLKERGRALFAVGGPLQQMLGARVRCVFRDTAVYGALACRLRAPELLRSGVDQSLELDALLRAAAPFVEIPAYFPMFAAEKRALLALDIPYFSTTNDSTALPLDDGTVLEALYEMPPWESARARILGSNEKEVSFQKGVIRVCLALTSAAPGHGDGDEEPGAGEPPSEGRSFAEAAEEIAFAIRDSALGGGRRVGFIAPVYAFEHGAMQLRAADESLYSGTVGIAVFLAAASRVNGSLGSEMDEFLWSILSPLRAILSVRSERDALVRRIGIGGATGAGSILYGLALISGLRRDIALAYEAFGASALIDEDAVRKDRDLDVIGGSAGAILGLLALYETTRDKSLVSRAMICGEHLLRSRIDTFSGHRAFPYRGGRVALPGFSHGAAGIAYALVRLFEVTGDERLREAAREAVAYERSLFDGTAGCYRDLRPDVGPSPAPVCGFCHGAAGIGLSRIYCAKVESSADFDEEISICAETTLRFGLGALDHLCCGNAGRAELLLSAGHHLGRKDLVTAALDLMARVDARAVARGGYAMVRGLERHISVPSLFRGTAGVGYQLLRLQAPDVLPSVLGWEMPGRRR